MEKIQTSKAPKAIWPYSQAVKANGFLYISWQIPLEPSTMEIIWDDIVWQTHQVCKNIWAILEKANLQYKDVIKTTIYLDNMSNFQKVNEIYAEYFKHKPARSTIEVSKLPKWALIEIETIAVYR